MELPTVLRHLTTVEKQGFIALCPSEYDMSKLTEMIEQTLAECEALAVEFELKLEQR